MEGGSPNSGSEVWLRGVVARDRLLLRSPAGEVRASLAYGAYCIREGEGKSVRDGLYIILHVYCTLRTTSTVGLVRGDTTVLLYAILHVQAALRGY